VTGIRRQIDLRKVILHRRRGIAGLPTEDALPELTQGITNELLSIPFRRRLAKRI
jgi:hypothetical protein